MRRSVFITMKSKFNPEEKTELPFILKIKFSAFTSLNMDSPVSFEHLVSFTFGLEGFFSAETLLMKQIIQMVHLYGHHTKFCSSLRVEGLLLLLVHIVCSLINLQLGLGTELRFFLGTDRNVSVVPSIKTCLVFRCQVSVPRD